MTTEVVHYNGNNSDVYRTEEDADEFSEMVKQAKEREAEQNKSAEEKKES